MDWVLQARADDDLNLDVEEAQDGEAEAKDSTATNGHGLPWEGSDRDYIYEELLGALPSSLAAVLFSLRLSKPRFAHRRWLCGR